MTDANGVLSSMERKTDTARWVATLSNGQTIVEDSGEFTFSPGEPKPWVKLTRYLGESDLYLTSLRLNFKGRTIHMPRTNFGKFGMTEHSMSPLFYSLQYQLEAEMGSSQDGPVGTQWAQKHYVDLIAHYPTWDVHYVQDLEDGNTSWVIVTKPTATMASTPLNPSFSASGIEEERT